MREVNVLEALFQASLSEVGKVFQEEMRGIIKESYIKKMFEEAINCVADSITLTPQVHIPGRKKLLSQWLVCVIR